MVNKRVRDVTDFVAYPMLSVDNSYCRLEIFRGPQPRISTRIKPPIYFNVEPVIACYNTYEEVARIGNKEKEKEDSGFEEMFLPIASNPAWIRYLKEKGYSDEQIIRESEAVQKAINPEGITSESQRGKKKKSFIPI